MEAVGKRLKTTKQKNQWKNWCKQVLSAKKLLPYGPDRAEEQERYVLEVFQEALERLK
jgi:hypothetical protein